MSTRRATGSIPTIPTTTRNEKRLSKLSASRRVSKFLPEDDDDSHPLDLFVAFATRTLRPSVAGTWGGECWSCAFGCVDRFDHRRPAKVGSEALRSSKGAQTMKAYTFRRYRKICGLLTVLFLGALLIPAWPLRAASDGARVVKYSKQDIVPVRAKLRFSTLIVLPDDEEILDFTTGDKEFWIINGTHNLCYVHPAQAGIRSNLNLITA